MNARRAGCGESRTSGSEGGSRNRTDREAGTAPRPDPYTYMPTDEGWLYLAAVLDAFSRHCSGWSMADHLRTELVLNAVELAIARRRPAKDGGLVHHSDHGCQYTSLAFGQRLQEAGIATSMGSVGDCYDNAVAESFFATLKRELLDRYDWPTRAAARSAIFEYIETWYNRQRRHSTLGYLSPVAFEAAHHFATTATATATATVVTPHVVDLPEDRHGTLCVA